MGNKAIVCNFHGCMKHDKGRVAHDTVISEDDLFDVAKEAYDYGLNVMIKQIKNSSDPDVKSVLYYSDKNFSQR